MSATPEELERRLREMRNSISDIEAAVIVSDEGLVLASAVPGELDEEKMAAMGGAMMTVGGRVVRDMARGGLEQVMIRGESGYVLLMPVGPRSDMMLTIMTGADAKLGWIMLESRRMAAELTKMLS